MIYIEKRKKLDTKVWTASYRSTGIHIKIVKRDTLEVGGGIKIRIQLRNG